MGFREWPESIFVTAIISFVGVFSFSRYFDVRPEFALYNAVGWSCVSISVHRLVLVFKRHG